MTRLWKPSTTVAAVIERHGRYLLVQEHTPEGLRLNNPAGHLEPGESLPHACTRETQEETGFAFVPSGLVGIYQARFLRPSTGEDVTYVRYAFCGELGDFNPEQGLDDGIVCTRWLTVDELLACAAQHRSPLVMRCVLDHARGRRFPLDLLFTDPSVQTPAAWPA